MRCQKSCLLCLTLTNSELRTYTYYFHLSEVTNPRQYATRLTCNWKFLCSSRTVDRLSTRIILRNYPHYYYTLHRRVVDRRRNNYLLIYFQNILRFLVEILLPTRFTRRYLKCRVLRSPLGVKMRALELLLSIS